MKFALFFLGEYAAMITGSAVMVTLFFGGWHLPVPSWHGGFHWALVDGSAPGWRGLLGGLFNIATFFAKVAVLIFIFMWIRWTLPRFRYDQLMRLGWLFFFEIALVNIFIAAGILAFIP
jgi:NADH-quinone oxidoreductase subunit H